ncbi:iron ABC transporter permease [Vibrio cyclitrophicus]|nr:iron ABC transporter permease [Vibrio cyclitrophicus]UPR53136.1 iron ABC transporter permease [Vibrio cyclitrophicus]
MNQKSIELLNGRLSFHLPIRALGVTLLLTISMMAVLIWSLMSGNFFLTSHDVIQTLLGQPPSNVANTVVWEYRFPRVLTAFLVGAMLALSGAALQYITRNPLSDPSLIGVSQGAALAVVSVTILMPSITLFWRPILAFAGSLTVTIIILLASSSRRGGETLRFILTGIGVAALISSFTSMLLTYGDLDRAMSVLGWLAGSVHTVSWNEVIWLTVTMILATPLLLIAIRPLSALRFGEEVATSLGVRVKLARWSLVTLAVWLAAAAVAAAGPLGFVGLVAPHLAKRLAQSGVGVHLLMTALTGALIVGLADFVGRVAFAPNQIPAGIITAIIGVPVFTVLILRTQARNQL